MTAQSEDTTTRRTQPNTTVTALPRCNFAGYCNFCGQQGCTSPDCIAIYLDTWWAACDICDGVGGDGLGLGCLCTYGIIQVGPERRGAIQPPRWPITAAPRPGVPQTETSALISGAER